MSTTNFVDKIKVNTGSGFYEADLQVSASNITDPNQNRNLRTLLSIDTPLFSNGETLASLLNSLGEDIQNNKSTLSKLLNLSAYKGTDGADGKSAYLYYAYSLNRDGSDFVTIFNELNITDDDDVYYFGVASSDDPNIQNIQEKFSTDDFAWIEIRRGLQGLKGEKGDTGAGLKIKGTLTLEQWNKDNANLLINAESADAYFVGDVTENKGRKIYVAQGDPGSLQWIDQGYLTSAPGERGPQGIQGKTGEQGEQGEQGTRFFTYSNILYTNEKQISNITFDPALVEMDKVRKNDYLIDTNGYVFKITNIDIYQCNYANICLKGPQGDLNQGTFLTNWSETFPDEDSQKVEDITGKTIYIEKTTFRDDLPAKKEYYSFAIPYNNGLKAIGEVGSFETIASIDKYNNILNPNATLYFTSILGSKNDLSLGVKPPQIQYSIINGDSNLIYGAPGNNGKDENIHIFGHSNYLGWNGLENSKNIENNVRRDNRFNNINIFGSNNKFYNSDIKSVSAIHSNYYIFGNNNTIDTNDSNSSPRYIFGDYADTSTDDIFIIGNGKEGFLANLLTIGNDSFNYKDLLCFNDNNQLLIGTRNIDSNDLIPLKNYFGDSVNNISDIVMAIKRGDDFIFAVDKEGNIRNKNDSNIINSFVDNLMLNDKSIHFSNSWDSNNTDISSIKNSFYFNHYLGNDNSSGWIQRSLFVDTLFVNTFNSSPSRQTKFYYRFPKTKIENSGKWDLENGCAYLDLPFEKFHLQGYYNKPSDHDYSTGNINISGIKDITMTGSISGIKDIITSNKKEYIAERFGYYDIAYMLDSATGTSYFNSGTDDTWLWFFLLTEEEIEIFGNEHTTSDGSNLKTSQLKNICKILKTNPSKKIAKEGRHIVLALERFPENIFVLTGFTSIGKDEGIQFYWDSNQKVSFKEGNTIVTEDKDCSSIFNRLNNLEIFYDGISGATGETSKLYLSKTRIDDNANTGYINTNQVIYGRKFCCWNKDLDHLKFGNDGGVGFRIVVKK